MIHTSKKRIHFRLSFEALTRLEELVKIANKVSSHRGVINRSDILEQIILKNTRNKLEVISEQIKEHAKEINRLQEIRNTLEEEAGQLKLKQD